MTIITGADSAYYQAAQGTLWTLAKFEPAAKVILLDLGLTQEQSDYLANTPPFYLKEFSIRKFDFAQYPSHFSIAQNSGRTGFRPMIIQAIAKEFGGVVAWLDAGCIIQGHLGTVSALAVAHGIFCTTCAGSVAETVQPSAQTALGVTPEIASLPMVRLGVLAFDTTTPAVTALIDQWVTATLNPAIAAPEGSTRWNHLPGGIFAALLAKNGWNLPLMMNGGIPKIPYLTLAEAKFRVRA